MKQRSYAFFFLGYVFVVTAFVGMSSSVQRAQAAVTASADPETIAAPQAGDPVAGRDAYTQSCSICHGAKAQGFIGPPIAGLNFGTAGIVAIVRQGLGGYGGMPAISSDAVSDRNVADIAAYLASLGPSPAPSPAPEASAATQGPSPGATSFVAATGDATHGKSVFGANCASCHGSVGQGGFGPSLKGEKNRKDFNAAVAWIKNPPPPMPKLYPATLSENDVRDVATYIENL